MGRKGIWRSLLGIAGVVYRGLSANKDVRHVIMTNCLAYECGPDPARFAEIEKLAFDRKEPFVPVLLSCSQEENRRRIVSPDRKIRKKLMNADAVEDLHRNYTMIHPADHPNRLEVDTSNLSVEQTFAAVSGHIQKLLTGSPGYQPPANDRRP